jgi:hypothetical protein
MKPLKEFYDVMAHSAGVRRKMVSSYLDTGKVGEDDFAELHNILATLEELEERNGRKVLSLDGEGSVELDLGYEIGELEKDLFFFRNGERAFHDYLRKLHAGFDEEVERCVSFLEGIRFHNFVTDRDGTINNYCGRYRSSIQSAYNAIFLARFIRRCTDHATVVTSAPLRDTGVVDVSVMPPNTFIYAASKAREFIDEQGKRRTFPIDRDQQELLDELNRRLKEMLSHHYYEKFALVGSGLQLKFGETTVARQDINKTISPEESKKFLDKVRKMVDELDPEERVFWVDDTGLDIEIIVNIAPVGTNEGKEFDKSDGLRFLNQEIGLRLDQGHTLVCGDTGSDIRLVEACHREGDDVWSVFVTKDDELSQRVQKHSDRFNRVSGPDMLVMALNILADKGDCNGS